MAHVLNDALSTCDRAGRKRRRGDFVLGSRVEDIAGGRLGSGGGDEERLRVQKRRYACRARLVVMLLLALWSSGLYRSGMECAMVQIWQGMLQAGAWGDGGEGSGSILRLFPQGMPGPRNSKLCGTG